MEVDAEHELSLKEQRAVKQHQAALSQKGGRAVGWGEALSDWLEHHAVDWRRAQLAKCLAAERREILRHKWIESEKANRDLGAEAVLDWIKNHAAAWRECYEREQDDCPAEAPDASQ
jgi:hypothetical protein